MLKSIFNLCSRRNPAGRLPVWLESLSSLPELESMSKLADSVDVVRMQTVVEKLNLKSLNFPRTSNGRIGYIPLIENDLFTLCVFYLPQGSALPYHDHPGQYVGLRVLAGELRIDSCDIDSSCKIRQHNSVPATPNSRPFVVRPDENNIHKINALKESLFLDFVLPPYSSQKAITYYRELEAGVSLTPVAERDIGLHMDYCDVATLIQDRRT
jgi:hypothetical protein